VGGKGRGDFAELLFAEVSLQSRGEAEEEWRDLSRTLFSPVLTKLGTGLSEKLAALAADSSGVTIPRPSSIPEAEKQTWRGVELEIGCVRKMTGKLFRAFILPPPPSLCLPFRAGAALGVDDTFAGSSSNPFVVVL